jgi:hypothetical protein
MNAPKKPEIINPVSTSWLSGINGAGQMACSTTTLVTSDTD